MSIHDLHRAELLMQKEKLKLKVDMKVKEKHNEIGLMCNSNCLRSIQDFDVYKHMDENIISFSV